MHHGVLPILLLIVSALALGCILASIGVLLSPRRPGRVKRMPYESGMDPVHDTRRRFDVRFHLLAIAFLVFDVEMLFLYPWAVVVGSKAASQASGGTEAVAAAPLAFCGGMVFLVLLTLGYIYDWKKGVFRWR